MVCPISTLSLYVKDRNEINNGGTPLNQLAYQYSNNLEWLENELFSLNGLDNGTYLNSGFLLKGFKSLALFADMGFKIGKIKEKGMYKQEGPGYFHSLLYHNQ